MEQNNWILFILSWKEIFSNWNENNETVQSSLDVNLVKLDLSQFLFQRKGARW